MSEPKVNYMPGGAIEIQHGAGSEDTAQQSANLVPPSQYLQNHQGTVEVSADGRVTSRGLVEHNAANLPKTGLTFYSSNGAKRIGMNEVTDDCAVEIPGVGMTTVGAAKRMGLLETDAVGNLKAHGEALEEMSRQEEAKAPEAASFETEETSNLLFGLEEIVGRDGVHAAANATLTYLADGDLDADAAFEKAGKALSVRTGADPAVAQKNLETMYNGYWEQSHRYVKAMGEDADAVFAFAETCSNEVKADIMRGVFMGRGPQVLKGPVQRYKTNRRI